MKIDICDTLWKSAILFHG